jgi:hypothetical protein
VEAARPDALGHRSPRKTIRLELSQGDDPMLAVGKRRQPNIARGFLIFVTCCWTFVRDPLHRLR